MNVRGAFLALSLAAVLPARGAISVSLGPSPASPQPLGTPIQWTATGSDSQPGSLVYKWQVNVFGGAFVVIRDYYSSNILSWTPTASEGNYQMKVTTNSCRISR